MRVSSLLLGEALLEVYHGTHGENLQLLSVVHPDVPSVRFREFPSLSPGGLRIPL